ncbi:Dcp1p-Dcp2p decapping enzyme complex alpha subunit [Friedmanniomyces endolithicus]|nr:Dcp1p-Dcp2p decapping enzyme complex alpha subunit [Friedmanniomyces endolithicus]
MGSSINLADVGTKLTGGDLTDQRNWVADLLDRKNTSFPGAQPVSFARHHIEELQHHDYFMCEKTDGIRCLMYLTQYVDQTGVHEAQFLVDRKNDYYFIPGGTLHIPPPAEANPTASSDPTTTPPFDLHRFHTGTLLDGELVLQTRPHSAPRLTYLMFDILALDGECIMRKTFNKRLVRLQQGVWRPYRKFTERYPSDASAQPFDIEMKVLEFPYAAEVMFHVKIPALPHGNDGLIFTCVETEYHAGTDEKILKWKPPKENTVDFRIELRSFPHITDEDSGEDYEDWDAMPDIELQINHGDRHGEGYKYYAMLSLLPAEWSALKRLHQPLDGRILECYREPSSGQWRPKLDPIVYGRGEPAVLTPRFRDDKTESNHISTVRSVEQSIRDAVSEGDLIAHAGVIRAGYKARLQIKTEEERVLAERAKAAAAAAAAVAVAAGEKRKREEGGAVARGQEGAGTLGSKRQVVGTERVREAVQVKRSEEEEDDDGPRYED